MTSWQAWWTTCSRRALTQRRAAYAGSSSTSPPTSPSRTNSAKSSMRSSQTRRHPAWARGSSVPTPRPSSWRHRGAQAWRQCPSPTWCLGRYSWLDIRCQRELLSYRMPGESCMMSDIGRIHWSSGRKGSWEMTGNWEASRKLICPSQWVGQFYIHYKYKTISALVKTENLATNRLTVNTLLKTINLVFTITM